MLHSRANTPFVDCFGCIHGKSGHTIGCFLKGRLHAENGGQRWRPSVECSLNAAGLAAKGDFTELMTYSTGQGYKPDYMYLLQRMMMDNPEAAVNLAKMVARQPGPPIELNVMADLFLQRNAVREATAFLLDVLQDNKPENDKLQTKVLNRRCHIT